MGRPRKQTEPQPESGRLQPGAASRSESRTVTIRFGEDGKPLPVQDETRERLRKALPDLLEEPLEEIAPSGLTDEGFAGHVLDTVNLAQSMLMERFTPLPTDAARKIIKFSESQKAEMTPRLMRILNRRLGPWLRNHPDEYALLLTLAVVEADMWARAKEAVEKLKSDKEKKS